MDCLIAAVIIVAGLWMIPVGVTIREFWKAEDPDHVNPKDDARQ